MPPLCPFWRPGMAAFGLALVDGLNRWNNGQITIYRKRNGLPDELMSPSFRTPAGEFGSRRTAGSPT